MARGIIRAAPLYMNGKKIAEVSDGTYDISSNDESHITTDGYAGHSDGAATTKINANTIVPVKGMQTAVDDALVNKRYVSMSILMNGKIHQIDMRLVNGNYKWDFKSGSCAGSFSFEGGAPEITG